MIRVSQGRDIAGLYDLYGLQVVLSVWWEPYDLYIMQIAFPGLDLYNTDPNYHTDR